LFVDEEIPYPDTFDDDYSNRCEAAGMARMRMEHLKKTDYKEAYPDGLSEREIIEWKYQHWIKRYLRTVASVDDNIGRLLKYLDDNGLRDNTLIVYTSDNGFFLGEHNWFDKRFMYEESLRVPFVARFPGPIPAGSVCKDIAVNIDTAPTFLDFAGAAIPDDMQGASMKPLMAGTTPSDWREAM
jgi:arylsulfatase A-like enzyme